VSVETDQEMFKYLGEVAKLAEGQMTASARTDLVNRLRSQIESRAAERKATKVADMRQILLGLGTPQALVMAEANKDPLYRARLRERDRTAAAGLRAPSVFGAEVDPNVSRMVTPASVANPPSDSFGAESGGSAAPGPEIPMDADPFRAGEGEWNEAEEEGEGGPQVPIEAFAAAGSSGGGGMTATLRPSMANSQWVGDFGKKAARSHTQAMLACLVLACGALANAVSMTPYSIAAVLVGYLLAVTSISYSPGEKRFAMIGVPIAALFFYAVGLFFAHGRSTGHDSVQNTSDTLQAARDGFGAVPTMLGLLAALYFLWRLFKHVARTG
jgi:hypothetical protein